MITYHKNEELEFEEYCDFLKRTDLGSQYPKEKFKERVTKTLKNRSISISARNEEKILVGICFGLTDFSYFLLITDLGIDRDYERKGIGKELMKRIQGEAGGEDDISMVTVSHNDAIGFYEKLDFKSERDILWKPCKVWTKHVVE